LPTKLLISVGNSQCQSDLKINENNFSKDVPICPWKQSDPNQHVLKADEITTPQDIINNISDHKMLCVISLE